jgi:hypothetical protein
VSQEKVPVLIDIAGSPDCMGGFGCNILSSAKNRSSSLFKDTLALTTCRPKTSSQNQSFQSEIKVSISLQLHTKDSLFTPVQYKY